MTQVKTKLSQRRAKAKKAAHEIVERFPCRSGPDSPHKLEVAKTRNGELLALYDDEIIATRGDCCWITQKEGIGVFDDADLSRILVVSHLTGNDGNLIPVGTECRNEGYDEAYRQRLDGEVTHNGGNEKCANTPNKAKPYELFGNELKRDADQAEAKADTPLMNKRHIT